MLDVAARVVAWLRPAGASEAASDTIGWGATEWSAARRAALVHGIAPLLSRRLEGTPAWAALDPEWRAYVSGQLAANHARTAIMRAELGVILHTAHAAGIGVMPLKGAILAERYYAEPGLRPMADLDLLTAPAALPRLDVVLRGLGYRVIEETSRHRAYLRGDGSVAAWDGEHPENPRGVEVHTAVGERLHGIGYTITECLWNAARTDTLAGAPCMLPAPVGLLHHLLLHTCHNLFFRRLRLVQLVDLALVAPALDAADWHALIDHAEAAGASRLLYAPLVVAESVFGTLAPPQARARLAARTPASLRELLAHSTPSALSHCNRAEVSPAFRLAWYWPGREQFAAIARLTLPNPTEVRWRYPTAKGGLPGAYARHIGRTAIWALHTAFGAARHRPGGG